MNFLTDSGLKFRQEKIIFKTYIHGYHRGKNVQYGETVQVLYYNNCLTTCI